MQIHEKNWFIWFHEFFWLDFFKFFGPLCFDEQSWFAVFSQSCDLTKKVKFFTNGWFNEKKYCTISDQRCHTDVFLLSTNIMDRFLAQVKLPKRQFQLLGATSIFLASKMVEPSPISALTLIKCTADTYDREELLVSSLIFG